MDNQIPTTKDSEIKLFLILAVVLFFLLIASLIFDIRVDRKDISSPQDIAVDVFQELPLEAKAVYIYDLRTETVIFAKNENTRLPLASLTKIMSALVAVGLSPSHGVGTISGGALQAGGDRRLPPLPPHLRKERCVRPSMSYARKKL